MAAVRLSGPDLDGVGGFPNRPLDTRHGLVEVGRACFGHPFAQYDLPAQALFPEAPFGVVRQQSASQDRPGDVTSRESRVTLVADEGSKRNLLNPGPNGFAESDRANTLHLVE